MKVIPVIHVLNYNQVKTNILTCVSQNVDYVFLINYDVSVRELLVIATKIRKQFPNLWVGVNMLGIDIKEAVSMDIPFDGMWCDQSMTFEAYSSRTFKGELFSGYNFKYQPKDKRSVEEMCLISDVITTSGEGTGKETPIEKVKSIKKKSTVPIAIASGVNKDNISNYKGLVDYILVASSITSVGEIIDKHKLKELLIKIG